MHVVEKRWKGSNEDHESTTLEVEVDADGFLTTWDESLQLLLG